MDRSLKYSCSTFQLLRENDKHQFAQSNALRIYVSGAIYSFIPKNACSTMRLSLAVANGCITDPNRDYEWIHQNNETFQADLPALATARYTFVILRCPFSRLVSAFLDKLVSDVGFAARFHDRTGGAVQPGRLCFRDFVRLLRRPGMQAANKHWRPQVDFIVYNTYDDYFCVEEFGHAVQTLQRKIGLDVVDARRLTDHGVDGLEQISGPAFVDAPAAELLDLKRRGGCPCPSALYDDELVGHVKELYGEDIALYSDVIGPEHLMFA